MAASSHDAGASSRGERFQLIRELGSRAVPIWAALEPLPNSRTQLVVAERVSRGGRHSDQEIADWVRDARRLAMLEHPNVARVRDVVIRVEDVLVVSDFVDGVRWSALTSSAQPPSLEVALRVFVDVLSGLGAVHNLRDAKREPLKLVHGELTPDCVLVGVDGVARVIGTHRMRAGAASPGGAMSTYLAPEVLLADDAADARADVYSVGAMLWEALSGRALFANTQPSAIVTQILSGRVPRAAVPAANPWAAPLADAAARALAADPSKRFGSTAAFAAELRRIAGSKLSPTVRVAALVRATHGDQVRARREALERGIRRRDEVSAVEPRSEPGSIEVPIEVAIDVEDGGWNAATTRPPPPAPPAVQAPLRLPAPPSPVASPAEVSANANASKPAVPVVAPSVSRAALPPPKLPPPRAPTASPPPLPVVPPVVPTEPLVPKDLGMAMGDAPVRPAEVFPPTSPPPSAAALSTSPEALPLHLMHRVPRRRIIIALVVGPAVLIAIVLIFRVASRTPERIERHVAASPPASSTTEPQYPTTIVDPPAESSAPTPLAEVPPVATAATSTEVAPETPSPTRAAPAPAVRPIPKQKYDPQGI